MFQKSITLTPNIDKLFHQGVQFENAYAQQALCGPSRTSFLTSRRPQSTQIFDNHSYWRTQLDGNHSKDTKIINQLLLLNLLHKSNDYILNHLKQVIPHHFLNISLNTAMKPILLEKFSIQIYIIPMICHIAGTLTLLFTLVP